MEEIILNAKEFMEKLPSAEIAHYGSKSSEINSYFIINNIKYILK